MRLIHKLAGLIPMLWGNWLSLSGTTLTTVAGNAILVVAIVDLVTGGANQYAAAFAFLVMPPIFLVGLVLIALGVWRGLRRRRASEEPGTLDRAVALLMSDKSSRRRLVFVAAATLANITLISLASYKGIAYMNSTEFCGQLCHSVMKPEYTAYKRSPHARVPCVDCHIGAGASWFVRSKLSGLRQVWATATGEFSRPIPTPVAHLRPARETCERCHWPQKFHGERLLVRHIYAADAKNTRSTSVVRLNVGGVNKRTGKYEGIHWHVAPNVRIEYEALDKKRSKIGKIKLVSDGRTTTFLPPEEQRGAKVVQRRVMDCVDCHNRPTHVFDPSPESAVDAALTWGKLDARVPYLRKLSVEQLKSFPTHPGARDARDAAPAFVAGLVERYRGQHPEVLAAHGEAIRAAGRVLSAIHERNIFPSLKIGWNTYPSHLGHRRTTEGCFRCHDDEHAAQGDTDRVVFQDCDRCHELLAQEEEEPDVSESILKLGQM